MTQKKPYIYLPAKESKLASNTSNLKAVEKKNAAAKKSQVCIASLL